MITEKQALDHLEVMTTKFLQLNTEEFGREFFFPIDNTTKEMKKAMQARIRDMDKEIPKATEEWRWIPTPRIVAVYRME